MRRLLVPALGLIRHLCLRRSAANQDDRNHSDDSHNDSVDKHRNKRAPLPKNDIEEFLDGAVPGKSGDQTERRRDKGGHLIDDLNFERRNKPTDERVHVFAR